MTAEGGVGRTTARAAVWAFLSTGGSKLITLVALMILARLLAPTEFGLLAFALVYITYAETIGDLGTGHALIYWPDRREDAAQVTFWVNVGMGIFWCVTTILIAPAVAAFFNTPNGTDIVRVLGFSFLIKYLGNTHNAIAAKDLRFRARTVPELGLAGLKAVISIVLAYLGFGAWSLAWGHLAGLACWTVFLWIMVPWRPRLALPRDLVGPMLRYGRGLIIVNIIGSVLHHADLAIVGRYIGTTALGFYQIAAKIPEATVIVLLWVVTSVLFPAFSRLHAAGQNLRRPYLTATRYVSAMTFPAATGLALLSAPLVVLFFGEQWAPAAPILTALAVYAGLRSLSNHAGDVLKATGRAPLLAGASAIQAVVLIPALLLGSMRSAAAVAWALAIVEVLAAVFMLAIASRVIGATALDIARSFVPAAIAASAMAVFLFGWLRWTDDFLPSIVVAGGVGGGAVVYLLVLHFIDPTIYGWIKTNVLKRGGARGDDLLTSAS